MTGRWACRPSPGSPCVPAALAVLHLLNPRSLIRISMLDSSISLLASQPAVNWNGGSGHPLSLYPSRSLRPLQAQSQGPGPPEPLSVSEAGCWSLVQAGPPRFLGSEGLGEESESGGRSLEDATVLMVTASCCCCCTGGRKWTALSPSVVGKGAGWLPPLPCVPLSCLADSRSVPSSGQLGLAGDAQPALSSKSP